MKTKKGLRDSLEFFASAVVDVPWASSKSIKAPLLCECWKSPNTYGVRFGLFEHCCQGTSIHEISTTSNVEKARVGLKKLIRMFGQGMTPPDRRTKLDRQSMQEMLRKAFSTRHELPFFSFFATEATETWERKMQAKNPDKGGRKGAAFSDPQQVSCSTKR